MTNGHTESHTNGLGNMLRQAWGHINIHTPKVLIIEYKLELIEVEGCKMDRDNYSLIEQRCVCTLSTCTGV